MARTTEIDWGRIPPERRGRWGRWLYRMRWERGRKTQDDVRATLATMGHPISEAYYSDFETGKTTPSPEWQAVFERVWGGLPEPDPTTPPALTSAPATDLSALVSALDRQTAAINALVELVGRQATERPYWVDDALDVVLAASRSGQELGASRARGQSGAPHQGQE